MRHASAPAFLALKFAAFRDRGMDDPFNSHDLEDILALLVSRPAIIDELHTSVRSLQEFVGEWARRLLARPELDDLLAGHLNNASDPEAASVAAAAALRDLAV